MHRLSPARFVAIFFVLAAAIVFGGVLGYTLKPVVMTTHVVVVSSHSGAQYDSPCVWTKKEKAC